MTDPSKSSLEARTFWNRLRRGLQQVLGFIYGTLLVGILVSLVSNLLSFPSIFDWITHHYLTSGLTGGGLFLLTALAYWRELLPITEVASSPPDQQSRLDLLREVRKIWIEDLLDKPFYRVNWINLHLQKQVKHPSQSEVQELDSEPHSLPIHMSIVDVYDNVVYRGLLILGKPGAGKTTLLLELTRTLLERAEKDEQLPLPIVFNLSSWAQKRQPLRTWMVEELWRIYQKRRKIGQSWIDADQVLPLLDGLDEVAKDARPACVQAINTYYQSSNRPTVICCRSEDYAALSTPLDLRDVVSILPLTDSQVNAYLEQAGEQVAALKDILNEDAELQSLVRQPLILNIFTLAYRGAILTEVPTGKKREEMQRIIFAKYVERMLNRRGRSKHWKPEQVIRRLTFLAARMRQFQHTTFYLYILDPRWLGNRRGPLLQLVSTGGSAGLVIGLVLGHISGLAVGLVSSLVFALLIGFIDARVAIVSERQLEQNSEYLQTSSPLVRACLSLIAGLGCGTCGGLIAASLSILIVGFIEGLFSGLISGLAICVSAFLGTTLRGLHDPPWRTYRRNLVLVLVVGLTCWLIASPTVGLVCGLVVALLLLAGALSSFWLRFWLWCTGSLPWNLTVFLNDAVDRLLMRKVGRGYVFMHRLLLEYFASLDEPESASKSSKA